MTKVTRFPGNMRPFAADAVGTERTVFGALLQSDTLADNINLDYWRGWGIVPIDGDPTKQDFNGLAFTLSQLITYLHQAGIPEFHLSQEYHAGNITQVAGVQYVSQIDANIGNDPVTDLGTNWLPNGFQFYKSVANGIAALDANSEVIELPAGAAAAGANKVINGLGSWVDKGKVIGEASSFWTTAFSNSTGTMAYSASSVINYIPKSSASKIIAIFTGTGEGGSISPALENTVIEASITVDGADQGVLAGATSTETNGHYDYFPLTMMRESSGHTAGVAVEFKIGIRKYGAITAGNISKLTGNQTLKIIEVEA